VRLMEKCRGKFESFLDVGIGTGILAITASKLGARRIFGIDHDKGSIKVAKENLVRNGIRNACVRYGDITATRLPFMRRFDLVAANLLSRTLIDSRSRIVLRVKKKGYLIVSGIARRNLKDFLRDFKLPVLRCIKTLRGRSWAACLYRRDIS
ncbi:MAG: 50S ribosomal protein L11 methyltransferase, partial [Candidatus Omnitrophica bacterium]|nr:50S ribosomal protein L11 methyltransferase [Candidatus Omnitrophota bacterium]